MLRPESRHNLVLLAIGLLVLLGPVLIIVLTLGFLALTGDLLLGRVTPLEFLELYIIDVLLFGALAYGLYRLTLRLIDQQIPASLEALEPLDPGNGAGDEGGEGGEGDEGCEGDETDQTYDGAGSRTETRE